MARQYEQIQRGWAMFDNDGDGTITRDEFSKFMTSDVMVGRIGKKLDQS